MTIGHCVLLAITCKVPLLMEIAAAGVELSKKMAKVYKTFRDEVTHVVLGLPYPIDT